MFSRKQFEVGFLSYTEDKKSQDTDFRKIYLNNFTKQIYFQKNDWWFSENRKQETNFRWVDIFRDFFEKFLQCRIFPISWKKEIVRKHFAICLKMFNQKNL